MAGDAWCVRPTATATTHDRGGYGRPGRDIELVARGGRATSIDSSAPETKARGFRRRTPHRRRRRRRHSARSLTFPLSTSENRALPLTTVEAKGGEGK